MSIQTINPATEQVIQSYALMSISTINLILQKIKKAQQIWSCDSLENRGKKLLSVSTTLGNHKEKYATLIAMEMGKPISAARAEIEKCQWVCEFYAHEAKRLLAPRMVKTDFEKSYVVYQPLGILFAIMPWNYPFWQMFRFAAPNLMVGNACLLKPAEIVTGCGLAIEDLFREAGLTDSIFRTVITDHQGTKYIIEHNAINAVTLTGSERAGKMVGATAAGALKKVVLELGGSDPYLILEDADLEKAADHIVKSRMNNSGQVCIAAKRIIAVQAIYSQLRSLVLEKIKNYRYGNPLDESSNLGPLARADLRDTVQSQVDLSVKQGAVILCGGIIPEGCGFYYPPTVLENVLPGQPAFDDEIFGPVISMITAKDEGEAIDLANQSHFGLSAAVFTQNIERGEKIARDQIKVGTCCVNSMVRSDPRLPFGGIQSSGYGRELSAEGIHEFTNIKTICVAR